VSRDAEAVLVTERLTLRQFTPDDVEALTSWLGLDTAEVETAPV
jgi:hypothetical protein